MNSKTCRGAEYFGGWVYRWHFHGWSQRQRGVIRRHITSIRKSVRQRRSGTNGGAVFWVWLSLQRMVGTRQWSGDGGWESA